jgi:hypothetical protein
MNLLFVKYGFLKLRLTLSAIGRRSWLVVFCVAVFWGLGWSDALCAQVNPGFSARDMPWLDSEAGEVLPIDFGDRQAARSAARTEVPDAIAAPVQSPIAWNWAWLFWGGPEIWRFLKYFSYGLAILIIVVGAYFAYRYYYRWRLLNEDGGFDEELSTRTIEQSIQQLSFDVEFSDNNFREAAERAYRSGDLRRAIIYLFSHVLVSLDQKGHIRLRKGKTNREYLREIRGKRGLAKYYQRVMVPFEETFFGDYQLELDEFENCWSQLDQFQEDIVEVSGVPHV